MSARRIGKLSRNKKYFGCPLATRICSSSRSIAANKRRIKFLPKFRATLEARPEISTCVFQRFPQEVLFLHSFCTPSRGISIAVERGLRQIDHSQGVRCPERSASGCMRQPDGPRGWIKEQKITRDQVTGCPGKQCEQWPSGNCSPLRHLGTSFGLGSVPASLVSKGT